MKNAHYLNSISCVNMADQEKLLQEIKTLSDSIRAKNRALRSGISEKEKFLEQTFKPVIGPLKEISNEISRIKPKTEGQAVLPFKEDFQDEESEEFDESEEHEETEASEQEIGKSSVEKSSTEEDEDEDVETTSSNISKLGIDIAAKGDLGRKYVLKMLQSSVPNRNYHVYGARLERNGLMIGDSILDVDSEDNIHVGDKTYKGTTGLFELIFKSKPEKYTKKDLNTFRTICKDTNVHKKSYLPNNPVHRNRSQKYIDVISQLFPSIKSQVKRRALSSLNLSVKKKRRLDVSGEGLFKNSYDTNVIYYNDLNKLVDRMRLIHEAIQAGHTGLENEWIALTEELRNKGIIE